MQQKPKVLIVDDEPFNVDYLEQELEDLNYDILTAVNGRDALDKIESQRPDLVLLDIMMPVLDGFAVLAQIKADPRLRDIPVIVISASNDLESVVKGIQQGAEDYLPKPFEPTLLHARISASLEKKSLRDQHRKLLHTFATEEVAEELMKMVSAWAAGTWMPPSCLQISARLLRTQRSTELRMWSNCSIRISPPCSSPFQVMAGSSIRLLGMD
jgi:CheY-like chemotaxis protein